MTWIADYILWILSAGWLLSISLVGCALLAIWRRFHAEPGRSRRSWRMLVGAALLMVAGASGLWFTGSGLVALGPGILAQRRMLGDAAPDFTYTRVADGGVGSLADHEGSVVLVNQWATWCPPCVEEMPALERLQQAYGARGLVVVHISDEPMETLARYLRNEPMTTEQGRADPLPWPDTGRPTTFLLDREGVVQRVVLGARSYEQFEAMVVPLL